MGGGSGLGFYDVQSFQSKGSVVGCWGHQNQTPQMVPSLTQTHLLSALGRKSRKRVLVGPVSSEACLLGSQKATFSLSSLCPLSVSSSFLLRATVRLDGASCMRSRFTLITSLSVPSPNTVAFWGVGSQLSPQHVFSWSFLLWKQYYFMKIFYYVLDVLLLLIICYNISFNTLEEVTDWRWYRLWSQTWRSALNLSLAFD